MTIEYQSAFRQARTQRGEGLFANVAFAMAGVATLLLIGGEIAGSRFDAALPAGEDFDQFTPTRSLTMLHDVMEVSLLAFPLVFSGFVFAIVSLVISRSLRGWISLAANLLIPAAFAWTIGR